MKNVHWLLLFLALVPLSCLYMTGEDNPTSPDKLPWISHADSMAIYSFLRCNGADWSHIDIKEGHKVVNQLHVLKNWPRDTVLIDSSLDGLQNTLIPLFINGRFLNVKFTNPKKPYKLDYDDTGNDSLTKKTFDQWKLIPLGSYISGGENTVKYIDPIFMTFNRCPLGISAMSVKPSSYEMRKWFNKVGGYGWEKSNIYDYTDWNVNLLKRICQKNGVVFQDSFVEFGTKEFVNFKSRYVSYLRVTGQKIDTFRITPEFDSLSGRIVLIFDNNRIKYIKCEMDSVDNLFTWSFSSNQLTEYPSFIFRLPKGNTVYLDTNQIAYFDTRLMQREFDRLYLHNNPIPSQPDSVNAWLKKVDPFWTN